MAPIFKRQQPRLRVLFRTIVAAILLLACILANTPRAAQAQSTCDGGWLPGDGIPGVDGNIYCSTMWDPDGPGPRTPLLVIGGYFTIAGNAVASNIAAFDPQTRLWSPLGLGMNGPVDCLTTRPNGDLIAGGRFTAAGGAAGPRFLARWNGTAWSSLGNGPSNAVYALTTAPNGDVIAGGRFGLPVVLANFIGRWDGVSWSNMGGGLSDYVYAVQAMPNGDILAAGSFTNAGSVSVNYVARWDGTAWSPLSTGMGRASGYYVSTLHLLPNGDLIAGGSFASAGGVAANCIARWDGAAWSPLGNGMPDGVWAIAQLPNGDLLIGGGGLMARWNGTGLSTSGVPQSDGSVYALTGLPTGDVIVGGSFNTLGDLGVTSMAVWNGQTLSALGLGIGGSVNALATLPNGDLVAGGSFATAGGTKVRHIARGAPSTWATVGSGLGLADTNSVRSIDALPNGNLLASGTFTTAAPTSALNIAQWNGFEWSSLGSGIPGYVWAQCVLPNGSIVVGGSFTSAGGVPASNIAMWNGTAWSQLGTGLDSTVYAVAVLPNGDVIAGGYFTVAGSSSRVTVARWDGASWTALGAPPRVTLHALAVAPNGDVLATFYKTVQRWNGNAWVPLGTGFSSDVNAIVVRNNGDLVVGGSFTTADGAPANHIALWNGAGWVPLGSGTNSAVNAVKILNNGDLAIGGDFTIAGGQVSSHVARYHFGDTIPVFSHQPTAALACPDSFAHFSIVAGGSDSFTYQWQVLAGTSHWANLGTTPIALNCGGAATSTNPTSHETSIQLTPCPTANPLAPQRFFVRCIATNSCQSLASSQATFTTCPADFNCSGSLSAQDIFDYLTAWFALDPRDEVNASGTLDQQDIFDFIAAWFAGC